MNDGSRRRAESDLRYFHNIRRSVAAAAAAAAAASPADNDFSVSKINAILEWQARMRNVNNSVELLLNNLINWKKLEVTMNRRTVTSYRKIYYHKHDDAMKLQKNGYSHWEYSFFDYTVEYCWSWEGCIWAAAEGLLVDAQYGPTNGRTNGWTDERDVTIPHSPPTFYQLDTTATEVLLVDTGHIKPGCLVIVVTYMGRKRVYGGCGGHATRRLHCLSVPSGLESAKRLVFRTSLFNC